MEVQQGRSDAFYGSVLINRQGRVFDPVPLEESHFLVPGDAKSLVAMTTANDRQLVVAGQNNDKLKVFILKE